MKDIEQAKVYEARYNPCIHESGFITLSIHRTPRGAEMAIEYHRNELKKEWDEIFNNKPDDYYTNPFGEFEAWDVKETIVQE